MNFFKLLFSHFPVERQSPTKKSCLLNIVGGSVTHATSPLCIYTVELFFFRIRSHLHLFGICTNIIRTHAGPELHRKSTKTGLFEPRQTVPPVRASPIYHILGHGVLIPKHVATILCQLPQWLGFQQDIFFVSASSGSSPTS